MAILNYSDYVNKTSIILSDTSKFKKLGDISFDYTLKMEIKFQRRLLKVHKVNVPLRPILSMVGSVQHELAKWLVEILDPVLKFYSDYCTQDSFQFVSYIHKLQRTTDNDFLMSFDICSLFTNVPLDETIDIYADYLHHAPLKP